MNSTTEDQALKRAHNAGQTGLFRISAHARQRMEARGTQRDDVRAALRSTTRAIQQEGNKWRLEGGTDLDCDRLTVVAAIDSGVVVVTVF